MDKKIIFFDIDGTLVPGISDMEYVPKSTIEAIQRTRAKGNLVYLCTGRSQSEIYDFILDIGIDGVIGAGGCYILVGDEMLFYKCISGNAVRHMVDYFENNNFDYYLETNEGLYASKNLKPRLKRIIYGDYENDPIAKKKHEENNNHFINALMECDNMYHDKINKACFLENKNILFGDIKKEFEDEFNVIHCTVPIFGDDSGEISVLNIHKADAIEILLNHLGIDRKNTYAFGDGLNDIEMLEYVEVGIAVGNAKDGLKAVADEVTDDSDKDGIYNSMKKHDLL